MTEDQLRQRALARMNGLAEIVRLRKETGDPDDLADAAYILGAIDDFSEYVGALRARLPRPFNVADARPDGTRERYDHLAPEATS